MVKRWFYFYNLNGLMIRVLTGGALLWISYGHRAQWQFKLTWLGFDWPKPEHRIKIWHFGPVRVFHAPN